jgi:hypothetical protein
MVMRPFMSTPAYRAGHILSSAARLAHSLSAVGTGSAILTPFKTKQMNRREYKPCRCVALLSDATICLLGALVPRHEMLFT